ncbi:CHAT domain-containing protein/tetratricopeptide (TPR) repeat protein [Silvibacterium bohemicum]|uniref:CHAT domain-containing protein/tetratricopeptide (TPR) repeat protein n=1 Tax=Silvibacterium bohemicum TaxID=1577686 RepID=A0A841JYN2_9BACT|nr:CHAT domain-containing protein [Silvibacterium bohemicum]MBB6144081.1 CHAT domain-containing protein/tetratricopeptide (TPR) repeat protein [Silvibacterium bohemicum]
MPDFAVRNGILRSLSNCLLAAVFAFPVFAFPVLAQQKIEPSPLSPYLDPTPTITRVFTTAGEFTDTLKPQSVASYSISLNAGDVASLRLLQTTGEVGALWLDPARQPHSIRRNDSGRNSAIPFTLIAAGSQEIRVRCLSTSTDCTLTLSAQTPRPASASDTTRGNAEDELAEGDQLRRKATAESRAAASPVLDQALASAKEIQDGPLIRRALYLKARLAYETRQFAQARDLMLQAVAMPESPDDIAGTAVCWKMLGYSYASMGELDRGLSSYAEARKFYARNKDALNQEILNENSARAHRILGENGLALEELTAALEEARSIHDERGLVASLEELGNIHLSRGDLQEALDAYRQAIQSPEIEKNPTTHAHVLNGLGNIYTELGEYAWAQAAFDQSVALWRQIKDPMGEAYALDGEAFLAYSQADYPQSFKMHLAALDLLTGTDLERERASILEELGESYEAAGQKSNAVEALSKALALAQKLNLRSIEAACLRSLGEIALAAGDTDAAQKQFEQSDKLDATTLDKREQAHLMADRARLERMLGHLEQARTDIESAVSTIESSRTGIRSAESRTSYFDNQRDYYDFYISLLMQMDRLHPGQSYAASAFNISERARARSLLDTLHESGVETDRGVAPAFIGRERELSNQIEAKLQQLTDAEEKDAPAIRTQLLSLGGEYDAVENEIRSQGSGYGALVRGKTIFAGDLGQHLLDPNAVLLEYWLGEKESYLWAITSTSTTTYRLPSLSALQTQSSALYAALTARNTAVPNETAETRQLRIQKAEQASERDGIALERLLLQPGAQTLHQHTSVVIVAEGPLSSLPFQALPFDGKPLIETHQVVYLPSASLLPELRRNQNRSPHPVLAVFADPVFSPDDPRVDKALEKGLDNSARTPASPINSDALTRSSSDLGLDQFPRLSYSREEAQAIGQLLPERDRKIALDFDANRDAVLNTDWSRYTIVHFSTHALVDDVHPDLSGIVLSLMNPSGQQIDGFLRVHDIYKLHMPADLVVLSACRTALGKKTRGEGVIGLSRAFSYAGSHKVLATLWNVNDRATAALMENFYEGLLKQGLSPAAALARAQRTLAHSKNWHSPYFWAPFILLGDWQQ